MIVKIIATLSTLGLITSLILFIKSGWSSDLGQMDYKKANKRLLIYCVLCFAVFYFNLPKPSSKTYKNSYHEFSAEFSVNETGTNCSVDLYSKKAYPAEVVFTEEVIKETREFLKEWPNVKYLKFHTPCGEKILYEIEVKYLKQNAKKDQLAELGYNLGLYDLIDNCAF
jgi:hypothetical protein